VQQSIHVAQKGRQVQVRDDSKAAVAAFLASGHMPQQQPVVVSIRDKKQLEKQSAGAASGSGAAASGATAAPGAGLGLHAT
jgi:hypothetical protein